MDKKPRVYHPILITVASALAFFAHNVTAGLGYYREFFLTLGFSLIPAALLFLFCSWVMNSRAKGGLVISLLAILFFSYGHIHDAIEDYFYFKNTLIGADKILFGSSALILMVGTILIWRWKRGLVPVTKILNVVALTWVMIPLLRIGSYEVQSAWASKNTVPRGLFAVQESGVRGPWRDIYFIILDAYTNEDTLKNIYHFDNRPFLDWLRAKGFYVAGKSHSNYSKTRQSLAATLNMEYVNTWSKAAKPLPTDQRVFYQGIQDNRVAGFLKTKGYEFISIYEDYNKSADFNLGRGSGANEFLMVFIQTTALKPFLHKLIRYDHRQHILKVFKILGEEVPRIKGPKFVFAHIFSPHPPFVFGADGGPVEESKLKMFGDAWENPQFYSDQLQFISVKTKHLIEAILEQSEVEPIIIIQGDHGGMTTLYQDGVPLEENPGPISLQEMFRILSVYHLPDGGERLLYEGITPVNNFPVVLNYYFGTTFNLLEDRSFYSTTKNLHEYREVTEVVKYE